MFYNLLKEEREDEEEIEAMEIRILFSISLKTSCI